MTASGVVGARGTAEAANGLTKYSMSAGGVGVHQHCRKDVSQVFQPCEEFTQLTKL
jgi:hypothetical protein